MVLRNVMLMDSPAPVDISIENGRIKYVAPMGTISHGPAIDLDNAIAFPGLVNSHDHLDFNLFPKLGSKIYINYTDWGKYIHQHYKAEIDAVLKVPLELREQWGIYKNLLCGVTTVVNHGEKVKLTDPLIHVYERYQCLHSVGFEKNWQLKLNKPSMQNMPVVAHVGEGTDEAAHTEISKLISYNLLNKPLIGVHGVAMDNRQAAKFKALVWCPDSNFYLLNKTAPVDELKTHTTLLFGTDSTLTSGWNIWEHLRLARATGLLSDTELYNTLNKNAAAVWRIDSGINAGIQADIVVARQKHSDAMESFYAIQPEDILLVIRGGEVLLFDDSLSAQIGEITNKFSQIYLNNSCKHVKGNLPGLIENIREYYPGADIPVQITQYAVC